MIAILAGIGSLPVDAAKIFAQQGTPFFVLTLFDEDNGDTLRQVCGDDNVVTQDVYKASALLDTIKSRGATEVLLVGKVDKRHLLKKVRLDWLALKMLASVATKGDTDLMEAIVARIEQEGITVLAQHAVLGGLRVEPGVLCGTVTEKLKQDIEFGIETAERLSKSDIGQTVVVKDHMVVAVEAIEGTDECIKRGIALGKEGVVICKAARIDQNKKFDLPTLGPDTIAQVQPGQVSVLAWQASQTFIIDRELLIAEAKKKHIALVAV